MLSRILLIILTSKVFCFILNNAAISTFVRESLLLKIVCLFFGYSSCIQVYNKSKQNWNFRIYREQAGSFAWYRLAYQSVQ